MTTAVYAGSFDPPTLGHLDLISRSSRRFDRLIVAVGQNSSKDPPLFEIEERVALIQGAMKWECSVANSSVTVKSFSGMLVDFCHQELASVIVRGLRAASDFEAEMTMAHANETLSCIDTVFFPSRSRHSFVRSSIVKEIAGHNTESGWTALSKYCPENVVVALRKKFDKTWTEQHQSKSTSG